jgi:hypothetical protein
MRGLRGASLHSDGANAPIPTSNTTLRCRILLSKSDGGGPGHEQAGSPGYLSRPDPARHSSARAGVGSGKLHLSRAPVIEGRPEEKQFVVPRLQVIDEEGSTQTNKWRNSRHGRFNPRRRVLLLRCHQPTNNRPAGARLRAQQERSGAFIRNGINWPSAPRSDRRPAFRAAG